MILLVILPCVLIGWLCGAPLIGLLIGLLVVAFIYWANSSPF